MHPFISNLHDYIQLHTLHDTHFYKLDKFVLPFKITLKIEIAFCYIFISYCIPVYLIYLEYKYELIYYLLMIYNNYLEIKCAYFTLEVILLMVKGRTF